MVAGHRRVAFVAARKVAGYTQESLAEALCIDRSTVIRWEAGKYAPVPYLWPKLARLLGVSREQLRALFTDALLTAIGDLHLCAGWLALDAGQHDVARTCYSNALTVSRQAGDTRIESVALADLAMQSTVLFRPREALRYAAGAQHAASAQRDPWIGVLPHVRTAVASAVLGDAGKVDRAISDARRAFHRADSTARPEWATFLSHAELDGIEGTCVGKLGDAARGERLIEQAISGYQHEAVRNVALYRVRLAKARLDGGAVDGAAEAANAALDDLADNVVSWRVSSELDAVAERLAEYSAVEEAEAFLARYRSGAYV